jgi:hypothetical protein
MRGNGCIVTHSRSFVWCIGIKQNFMGNSGNMHRVRGVKVSVGDARNGSGDVGVEEEK